MSASGATCPWSVLSLRSFARPGSFAPPLGLSRAGSVSPLLLVDNACPGFPASLHSLGQLELIVLVLGFSKSEPFVPSQSLARLGLLALACGLARSGSLPLVSGCSTPEFPLSLRSHGRSGSFAFVPSFAKSGSAASLRELARLEASTLIFGIARAGSVFFLPVVDKVQLGFPPLLRSSARVDLFLLASNSASPGFFVSSQSPARLGPATFVSACSSSGPPPPLRGPGQPGFTVFVSGTARLGPIFFLPVAAHAHLGFSLSLRSFARVGPACFVCASAHLGFLASSRSLAQLDVPVPVPMFSHLGLSMPSRSLGRAGSLVLVFGASRSGSVSAPSVPDLLQLGSLLSLRAHARPGPSASITDFLAPGSFASSRSPACPGPTSLLADCAKVGLPPPPQSLS